MPAHIKYRRVLLKLSGESLCPTEGQGIEAEALKAVVERIGPVKALGVELAIVVGGGNFIRARGFADHRTIRRVTADYMGMLGTVINALALRDALEAAGMPACVMSALPAAGTAGCGEPVDQIKAVEYLTAGRVVVFAGGTGSPFFTTDTTAALRASEIAADVIVKATKVEGVYDSDPMLNPKANMFDRLTHHEALAKRLAVMDHAAFSLCAENHIPIIVCQVFDADNLARAVRGEKVGTLVSE
jgi:uridylate kinase